MKLFDAHADLGVDILTKHQQGRRDVLRTDHLDKLKSGEVFEIGRAHV